MLDISFIKNCLSIVEKSIEAPINKFHKFDDGYDRYLIIYRIKGGLKSEVVYGSSMLNAETYLCSKEGIKEGKGIVSIRLLGDPYNALDLAQNFELDVRDNAILTFKASLNLRYYNGKPYGVYVYTNIFYKYREREKVKNIYFFFPNFAEQNSHGVIDYLPTLNGKPKQIENRRLKMSLKLLEEYKDEKIQFFEVTNFSFLN